MSDRAVFIFQCVAALFLGFALVWTIEGVFGMDGFVGTLERHYQVSPGQTRVLPECNCTIRYMGTTVSGRHYTVHIDRLD